MNKPTDTIYKYALTSQFDNDFLTNNKTDQQEGMPEPSFEKVPQKSEPLIDLPAPDKCNISEISLSSAIKNRRSYRKFLDLPLTLAELSFLLWATLGTKETHPNAKYPKNIHKVVPSGGARHPIETYLIINNVTGLQQGLYRYISLQHKLSFIKKMAGCKQDIIKICINQGFAMKGAVLFIWTAIPYRTQWRYGTNAPKIIAQQTGHVCQNLYLATQSIGAGTCAISAYNQQDIDKIIDVDGKEELVVYLAPVGKVPA